MSNILANNRLNPSPSSAFRVDIVSHLADLFTAAGDRPSRPFPVEAMELLRAAVIEAVIETSAEGCSIDIAIVDDKRIHELNRRHLNHDWETDVISFPYDPADVGPEVVDDGSENANAATWWQAWEAVQGARVAGELIVSWETAIREASSTGWPALTELLLYCVHGTLHLAGLDDIEPEERSEMRNAEQRVLRRIKPEGWQLYDVDADRMAESAKPRSTGDSTR